jgi:uncharacterized protein (DUF2267 family)
MKAREFLAQVRERGSYADQAESEQVTRAVLGILAERLDGGTAKDVAAQLPEGLQDALLSADKPGQSYGVEEFLRHVAAKLNTSTETAKWDASAVLSTLAEAVTGGQLNKILTQLPSGYALLFGKPELSE